MKTKTPPWKKKRPNKAATKLSAASKAAARKRAALAGRTYPNLIDNMYVAKAQKAREKQS